LATSAIRIPGLSPDGRGAVEDNPHTSASRSAHGLVQPLTIRNLQSSNKVICITFTHIVGNNDYEFEIVCCTGGVGAYEAIRAYGARDSRFGEFIAVCDRFSKKDISDQDLEISL
jgi:hypothetical protein